MNKFYNFMNGRYGIDDLYNYMFKLYISLFIINLFFNSSIISIIEIILVVIIFYRFFSKNIDARVMENNKFLNIKSNLLSSKKYKEGYIYKKCPKCKKLLKFSIPYKKGLKCVICPKCNKKFRMLVMKSEKIEIISNKK